MNKNKDVLSGYPDPMCQGQLCEVAHISKRRAKYLLGSGIIPNIHSPNRRLGYQIRKADVRDFLQRLAENPEGFSLPPKENVNRRSSKAEASPQRLEAYYQTLLQRYPDILDVHQVMELTGYGTTAVHRWFSSGKLPSFLCGNKRRIPQKFLLAFLLSEEYQQIPQKSARHQAALLHCREKR